jgi:nucleoid-associated protein YgaU
MLPPGKPLQAEESLSQVEGTAPAASETEPPTTAPAATTPAKKTSLTTPRGPGAKPRLSYTVSAGELLWAIAKRVDVYGDPLLWPLLYQANRDQIKDPRKIYAGQTLSIPRNINEE